MFAYSPKWTNSLSLQTLESMLSWEQPTIRMFGKSIPIPRLTCWMGDAAYTYSGHKNTPVYMPEIIRQVKDRLETGLGVKFNSVLANYYRTGSDSVSWHSDDEPELGPEPVIASLSIGASRTFQVKHKTNGKRTDFKLGHGDLLVMSGKSQADYLHCIPKTTKPGARINLTFRLIK